MTINDQARRIEALVSQRAIDGIMIKIKYQKKIFFNERIITNKMKFITKQIHAYLDYPVAIALIILPFILGLGSSNLLAVQLSVLTGVAAFILTILTNHQTGIFRIISYKMHLIVDFLVAIVFLAAPFIFSFNGIDALYYWLNGAAVLAVVSLHKPETSDLTLAE